jgi:[CysO sulfur-carrier protein]-S-L-cysteine hydrolase
VSGSVRIRGAVVDEILRHARSEAPVECCGLLIGAPGQVSSAVRARNLLSSPTRFQVDPQDHFAAIRQARADGLAVIGVYHSHPASDAEPSEHDLSGAADPDLLYVIAGLADGEVRGFRLQHGNFHPVVLVPCS